MKKPVVLLVDDHEALQETITQTLVVDGYEVITASNSNELLKILPTTPFDLVLLDLILPDADGLALIARIREYTDVPIIVISSKSEMTDKVVGLEMGADDYISKPLPLKELSARIKAHLRRYNALQDAARKSGKETDIVKFGRWTLDRMKIQVFDENGVSCNLSAKEFRLLESLVNAQGRVRTRTCSKP
jgi:DNA-binding response OmpR family regulator